MLSRTDIKLADSPEIQEIIKRPIKVNKSYDIPYVAGYSTDAKTVYIDQHFKDNMHGKNVLKYVVMHEVIEKHLIDKYKFKYEHAHLIALYVERKHVRAAGLNWNRYEDFVLDQYKGMHHEKLQNVPSDLDLTPYKDSHELKIMKDLIHVGHIDKKS